MNAERGNAMHAETLAYRALYGERVHRTMGVPHQGLGSAQKPEPATVIHVANVACPMPHAAINANLRLLFSKTAQVARHDMRSSYNDLAGCSVRHRERIERDG